MVEHNHSMFICSYFDSNHFFQHWHIPQDLNAEVISSPDSPHQNQVLVADCNGGTVMRIVQLDAKPAPASARVASGEMNPILGWTSPAHNRAVPSPTVVFGKSSDEARFFTLLDLSDATRHHRLKGHARDPSRLSCSWKQDEQRRGFELDLMRTQFELRNICIA